MNRNTYMLFSLPFALLRMPLRAMSPAAAAGLASGCPKTVGGFSGRTGENFACAEQSTAEDSGEPPSSRRARSSLVALLSAVALLAIPGQALAASITFQVSDSQGRALAGVWARGAELSPPKSSSASGAIQANLSAGTKVYFSRASAPGASKCAPEGYPGKAYTVPDPVPASATIVLPACASKSPAPAGRDPRLRLSASRSGATVRLRATLGARVRGGLHLYARSASGRRIALASRVLRGAARTTAIGTSRRLPDGRWRLVAVFNGRSGWRSRSVTRLVQIGQAPSGGGNGGGGNGEGNSGDPGSDPGSGDPGSSSPCFTEGCDQSNPFPYGQCTWLAYEYRPDILKAVKNTGWWASPPGARDWDEMARDGGFSVDGSPRVGDMAGSEANGGGQGHLAYVKAVNSDGTITITDMNGSGGPGQIGTATVAAAAFDWFIHQKG